MDYQALSMFVSKPVQSWNLPEIKKWLNFIHMQKLLPLFENNRFINGELLTKINNKSLSQIGVTSNIMQKKLMAWVEKGFSGFNEYLNQASYDKENICPNLNSRKTSTSRGTKKILNTANQTTMISQQSTPQTRLRITSFQGPQNVYYIADKKGLKIGRNLSNQIQSLQVTVQNNHAEIIQQGQQFKLIDLGTKSGTFFKIHYKVELQPQMLIEIGSYLLKVTSTNMSTKQITFGCINITSNQFEQLNMDFTSRQAFSMGRRNSNDFYRDDQHMSGTHAKIYFLNGKFILEDMGSTNGTWLRLSEFRQRSAPLTLKDGAIFKIGNTITYICTYERPHAQSQNSKMEIEQNSHICQNCCQNERNTLFLPCKHSISCESCSVDLVECPLCRHQIEQTIKIFI